MAMDLKYPRILLKLSGEGLMGPKESGLDPECVDRICEEILDVQSLGAQLALVIGAGNIFRGMAGPSIGIERANADYMGMLATIMNALAVQSVLEGKGVPTRVQSAIPMATVCEPYIRRRAMRHMQKGRIVIFAAGTGNPFFTTDTAAALRAVEMECDALLKGTQVDGVYDLDPKTTKNAHRYERLSYDDVIKRDLRVMDTSAIALARENKVPILVFSIHNPGSLSEVVHGQGRYTLIEG
ncbi:MAG: UMP kinase [Magnetovibrio sp.]|nr:UMP kinase [Magnetovibrio sp.]|tara:strand:+ start:671 stop:1390 length:720 start_codon:yes stop_codon:yes gene_type:complete